MELTLLWTIAQRELREALRNKWLWFYTAGFTALAFALSQAGVASAGYAGLGGFGRTAASLINALLLFAPLIGLSVGAHTLAADRERGTLVYLMAQPVNRAEVFFGKALGAALAVVAALGLGFGLAGLGLASAGGGSGATYLALAAYTLLLALASLGLGFIISVLTRKGSTASGPAALLAMLLANPLQVFKLAAIYGLRATLDTLGPVGQFAVYRFGDLLPLLLVGLLAAWIVAGFGLAFAIFRRKGDL